MKRATCLLIAITALAGCTQPSPPPADRPAAAGADFANATEDAGLSGFMHTTGASGNHWFPETMGSGVAFADLNGDGADDLAVVGGGTWDDEERSAITGLYLYMNDGEGLFQAFDDEAARNTEGYGFGVVSADYDNDGDADLFVTAVGRNTLLRNEGGSFENVTADAGLAGPEEWSTAAAFVDLDQDGLLDLLVANYVAWSPETDIYCSRDGENKGYCTPELYEGQPLRAYRNQGDGTFLESTEETGLGGSRGKTLGIVTFDFNRDGAVDVALANDTEPDELYMGVGDGTLREIGVTSGMAFDERGRARAGMGISAGVLDGSGKETLVIGNFSQEMLGVYQYLENEVFLDRAAASQLGRPSLAKLTFGLELYDADLDGDLDIVTANGHVQPQIERVSETIRFRQPVDLFLNDAEGVFQEAGLPSLSEPLLGRGLAVSDADLDGDVDMLVSQNGGGLRYFRNEHAAPGDSSVRLRLVGTTSNRDAIGARVEAVVGGRVQHRFVRSGGSYLSQSSLALSLGLGGADQVDELTIFWPSGEKSRFTDVMPASYRVVEGESELTPDSR